MGIIATSQAVIRWPQQQEIEPGGYYNVYADARDGVIDYATPCNAAPKVAWPENAGRVGDGLGPDGSGADGYGYGGIGDGAGADGYGWDGFGAALLAVTSGPLADGTWLFAVVGYDAAGNPSSAAGGTTAQATLAGTPEPPASIEANSYDDVTGTLAMTLGLSADDEAST